METAERFESNNTGALDRQAVLRWSYSGIVPILVIYRSRLTTAAIMTSSLAGVPTALVRLTFTSDIGVTMSHGDTATVIGLLASG